ncbi:hypothetical protein [Marinobacter sp. LN3S78]|uniref:hypothetical protein n=1 Tax=Marinobacter sp. LN3S78 TaxID=3382300 RepID=UPI00387B530A
MPEQIEIFDKICGALLLHLYDHFPVKINVEFTDLPLDQELDALTPEEISHWMTIFVETAFWLSKENFIRFDGASYGQSFHGMQLSMSGLAVLRSVPGSVDGGRLSLVERIKGAFSEGGKVISIEGLKVGVGALLTMQSGLS